MENPDHSKLEKSESLDKKGLIKLESTLTEINQYQVFYGRLKSSIEKNSKTIFLNLNNKELKPSLQNASSLQKWFNLLLQKHQKRESTKAKNKSGNKRAFNNFNKKFNLYLKNLKNRTQDNDILIEYFEEARYQELYNVIHNLQSLPGFLLSLDTFKGYSNCQIIAHEKGQGFASSITSSVFYKTSSKRVSLESFNKIYQSIKKSKSKIFQSETYNSDAIEVIGTFLAHSFKGVKHDIILIFGCNGFLPPTAEEINNFESISNQLQPVFNAILRRSFIDEKVSNIIDIFETFHLPMSILDKSHRILFQNKAFEIEKGNDFKNFEFIERELHGRNLLRFYFKDETKEEADLYHLHRVSLLGELLNTLQHELSNPLFGLSLASEMLDLKNKDQEIHETVSDVKSNIKRCQKIIKNFSSLYDDEENFKSFDLIHLIKETIVLTKSETKGIKKIVSFEDKKLIIFSNPTWISQIIFNLVINAGQAIQTKYENSLRDGIIEISISRKSNHLNICIADNGAGVLNTHTDKLFSAFFTTKETGTGLGLSICRSLAGKLGGEIVYLKCGEDKTNFVLSIPLKN